MSQPPDKYPPDRIDICPRCISGVLRPLQEKFYCFRCGYKGTEGLVFVREREDDVLEVQPPSYPLYYPGEWYLP